MAIKRGVQDQLFYNLIENAKFKKETGIDNYDDFRAWYDGLDSYSQIQTVVRMVNTLDSLDPILAPITIKGSEPTHVETFYKATFTRSSIDTLSKKGERTMYSITIPQDDYGVDINYNIKHYKKAPAEFTAQLIDAVLAGYRLHERALLLRGLTWKPEASQDTKDAPGFWRESLGALGVIAPPNGAIVFDASDTHYKFGAVNDTILDTLSEILSDKGYAKETMYVIANKKTWRAIKGQFTNDELQGLYWESYSYGKEFTNPYNTRVLVEMANSDFPDGYIVAYDPTVKGLYHRICATESMQGLVMEFSNMDELKVNNDSLFKVYETGAGVIDRSFGAIYYIGTYDKSTGTFTTPTAYANPTGFFNALLNI